MPSYTLEIFTYSNTDSRALKDYIYEKTNVVPTVYDNGTHYVINQKLTLEMLKDTSDLNEVRDVTGASTTLGCWISDSAKRDEI